MALVIEKSVKLTFDGQETELLSRVFELARRHIANNRLITAEGRRINEFNERETYDLENFMNRVFDAI
jgi:hypothetical protein